MLQVGATGMEEDEDEEAGSVGSLSFKPFQQT
jgi:hypothetical protein